jgi:HAE1 family hydrophobic/amphiphilic exporter-1
VLLGIVVNNGILFVDRSQALLAAGARRPTAVLRAAHDRLRPVLMTTATTVLGLLPMALGLGEGAELRAPLAVTVISGLLFATLLTLVVVPVVYTLLTPGGVVAPTRRTDREAVLRRAPSGALAIAKDGGRVAD